MASGLYITIQSIGDILGPLVSSQLAEMYGFKQAALYFSVILAFFVFLYFACCGNFSMFGPGASKNEEEQELINRRSELSDNRIGAQTFPAV
jgi:MFS family permease